MKPVNHMYIYLDECDGDSGNWGTHLIHAARSTVNWSPIQAGTEMGARFFYRLFFVPWLGAPHVQTLVSIIIITYERFGGGGNLRALCKALCECLPRKPRSRSSHKSAPRCAGLSLAPPWRPPSLGSPLA